MNPTSPSRYGSSSGPRPRRGREMSSDAVKRTDANLISPFASPAPSREGSPMPRLPPMRATSNGRIALPTSSTPPLWSSPWAAIHNLATTMLSDGPADRTSSRPIVGKSRTRPSSASGRKQWGPAPHVANVVGTGSRTAKDDRDTIAWMQKREALLYGNGAERSDRSGNFKRRLSPERTSSSVPSMGRSRSELETEDTLVYIYNVRKDDTLAGVVILFDCAAEAFRRANRFWPNDSIQTRQTVIVPVDSCSVKSTPVDPTEARFRTDVRETIHEGHEGLSEEEDSSSLAISGTKDLLSSPARSEPPRNTSQWASPKTFSILNRPLDTPEYTHVSWVILSSQPNLPIEIARLPRSTLSHFPPPNRRRPGSRASSRAPSFDLETRSAVRTSSNTVLPASGVGSLTVDALPFKKATLGPSEDILNKYLAPHLPDTSRPAPGHTPPPSAIERGIERSIENMGGAMENLMRKIVTKTQTLMEGPAGGTGTTTGDLIELGDTPGGDEPRGRERLERQSSAQGSGLGVALQGQQLRSRRRDAG